MQAIIKKNLKQAQEIFAQNEVERAYLFGSVCTDTFNETSDVDVLIEFNKNLDPLTYTQNYFKIANELEELFKRKVDLMTANMFHNPYFISEVNKTKRLIYG